MEANEGDDGILDTEAPITTQELKEIEASDVIRVVLQFLKENSLLNSFQTLSAETGVSLNTHSTPDALESAIKAGEWDTVLRELGTIELSDAVQVDLFEQIVLEMVEMTELETARKLLRSTRVMRALQHSNGDRYSNLESVIQRGSVDAAEWPNGSKKSNRKRIAKHVVEEIAVVPPSRLLTLIGQALKYQRISGHLPVGTAFNLFRGKPPVPVREDEVEPSMALTPIAFAAGCRPTCCAFSPDGQWIASGSTDGFIEIWSWVTSTLRLDLAYQESNDLMMHSADVLCLCWSQDGEMLASGDAKGVLKVWQVSTGKCVRRFKSAHEKGITSVNFSKDASKILTSSHDGTVRLHGLRSGKTIKFFRGHTSFVHRAFFGPHALVSCSTDGTIRVWDKKTEQARTLSVGVGDGGGGGPSSQTAGAAASAILDMVPGRDHEQSVIVCNRTRTLYRVDLRNGHVLTRYEASVEGTEFVAVALSSLGKFVYGASSDGSLFVFLYDTGVEETSFPMHKDIASLSVHPHSNIVATISFTDFVIKCFRPETLM